MSRWTVLFSSVMPASGTRQIDQTFMKGLLTIQDQELFKSHNKRNFINNTVKSRFSGDKTAPLAVSFPPRLSCHIGCFREFPKSARSGNSFLVLLGCPFGRYDFDLGTTFRAEKRNEHAWTFLPRSPGRVWKNGGISNIFLPKNKMFPLIIPANFSEM